MSAIHIHVTAACAIGSALSPLRRALGVDGMALVDPDDVAGANLRSRRERCLIDGYGYARGVPPVVCAVNVHCAFAAEDTAVVRSGLAVWGWLAQPESRSTTARNGKRILRINIAYGLKLAARCA